MKIFSMVTAERETEQWACVTAQFAPMKLTRSSMFLKGGLWYLGWNNSLLCRIFNIPDPWALHSTGIKMPPYISKCPQRGSYFSLLNSWSGLRCLQLGTMIITDLGKVMCNFCFGFSSRAKYRVELKRFQNSPTWESRIMVIFSFPLSEK